jgi:hypothetical protein
LAKAIQINNEETLAREYADRLILVELADIQIVVKLSEVADRLSDQGLGLAAVRSLLGSNPHKFAYQDRRWIPASRAEGFGRPFAEQARLIVDRFGGPMPKSLLVKELFLVRPDISEEVLESVLTKLTDVAISDTDLAYVRTWCFSAFDDTADKAFARHRITQEEVDAAQEVLKDIDWREDGAVAKALKLAAPIKSKVIGAVAWQVLSPQNSRSYLMYDWAKFYGELFAVPGFVYSSDGIMYPESEAKKWLSAAIKVADKLAPTIDIEDAAPIEVKSEDVDRMVAKISASEKSITAVRLLEEFYEITPSVKTYPDDLANMLDALKERKEILWVGADRFSKLGVVPEFVQTIPDIFDYTYSDAKDEDGELIDVELNDDGLSSTLRKLLNHPLATDVNDEDVQPIAKQIPETVRCVLKPIHRELGTFPLAQLPMGFVEERPNYQELILIDEQGRELTAWANTEGRLIFGLIDWFFEQQVESGAVFSLTRTSKPNVFEFAWLDQTDPVVFITTQRMEELRDLQSRSDEMTIYDILREVMSHWPKGADFLTVLWEVNVVRRAPRRLVASLLSSYACFYQRSGSPVWHYDSKKVEAGFDKTKRKFMIKR